jgi:hypothetical protein
MFRIRSTFFQIARFCHAKKRPDTSGIDWNTLKYKSKIPSIPVDTANAFKAPEEKFSITPEEIALLERLSLVDLDSR